MHWRKIFVDFETVKWHKICTLFIEIIYFILNMHGDSVKKKKKPDEILKDYSEAVVGN